MNKIPNVITSDELIRRSENACYESGGDGGEDAMREKLTQAPAFCI